jgi:hypothetical protein
MAESPNKNNWLAENRKPIFYVLGTVIALLMVAVSYEQYKYRRVRK